MNDQRIQKLIDSLIGLDGCLIEEPADLLYLTGLSLSKGRLWVSSSGARLFVDGRYFAKAQAEAPCPVSLSSQKALNEAFQNASRVSFDSAFLTCDAFSSLQKNFPQIEWVPISKPVKPLRLIKEAGEIAALKKAADLTWRGLQTILSFLKEGISETEASIEFETFCRKSGASGFSFEPIIAFGENSAYPHYRAGQARLQKNQIVLIDVGAVVDRYRGDLTRVHFFGKPDPKLSHLDQIVKRAQKKAVAQVRPGIPLGELDRIVREEFRKENLESFYTHSLGHGVGLETHEYPLIKEGGDDAQLVLQPGMVFTIEPGLYQPGLGGVRHEDMILVTETGHENFFPS